MKLVSIKNPYLLKNGKNPEKNMVKLKFKHGHV